MDFERALKLRDKDPRYQRKIITENPTETKENYHLFSSPQPLLKSQHQHSQVKVSTLHLEELKDSANQKKQMTEEKIKP